MTDEQIKLCKNCKYYKKNWIRHLFFFFGDKCEFDECRRTVELNFCSIERKDWYPLPTCGPDAKYFEER